MDDIKRALDFLLKSKTLKVHGKDAALPAAQEIVALIREARAEEAEACAKVCSNLQDGGSYGDPMECAEHLRARAARIKAGEE